MIPEISLATGVTLDIIGNGTTLDGGGTAPGLFVYQGSVSIDDLTLLSTTITGSSGGAAGGGTGAGGGGAGLGGGLFVGSNAAVTRDSVNFTQDGAVGGSAAPSPSTRRAGCGQTPCASGAHAMAPSSPLTRSHARSREESGRSRICVSMLPDLMQRPRSAEEKKARTSFCEQKEAKKLYSFRCRAVSAPREAEQKSFLVLFFKKELL